jgi:transposase InsO family protein
MDITIYPPFGRLKYIHVTVDTYSGVIVTTLLSGQKTKHVIKHLLSTFTWLGIPIKIKTVNAPGYTSLPFQKFCHTRKIKHKTGIPYTRSGNSGKSTLDSKTTIRKTKRGKRIRSSYTNTEGINHIKYIHF